MMRLLLLPILVSCACGGPPPPAPRQNEIPSATALSVTAQEDRADDGADDGQAGVPPAKPGPGITLIVPGDAEPLFGADPEIPDPVVAPFGALGAPIVDPLAFLDAQVAAAGGKNGPFAPSASMSSFPIHTWVKAEHIPLLLERLDSARPAAHVVAIESSMLPTSLSTEGDQARFILDGVRSGRFPPRLTSMTHGDPRPAQDYRDWWDQVQRIDVLKLPKRENGAVDWQALRPGDLLEKLCRHAGSAARLPEFPPYAWVTRADAEALVAKVRSKRTCAAIIVHSIPSRTPPPTTEGQTACMLLHFFREAETRSHHALLSTPHGDEFEHDPAHWESWWKEWSAQ